MPPGALEGLRVLDLTTLYPGPLATMILADLGADVLRVTAPGRTDLLRMMPPLDATGEGAAWRTLQRGKRAIALDLKAPGGRDVVLGLLEHYDVLIEQFRPGVMARLGLDEATLRARFPRLIYVSISSFGQTGPLAKRPGHDITFLARAGVPTHARRPGALPPASQVLTGDVGGGTFNAVIGLLAAVIHRQRTGEGQHVDISMADGALQLNNLAAAAALVGGVDTGPAQTPLNGAGLYDHYEARDGGIIAVGALEPHFVAMFLGALGLDDDAHMQLAFDDPAALKAEVAARLREHDAAHWEAVFDALPCCVERARSPLEAVDDPLFAERAMVVDVPLREGGDETQRQVGQPVKLSACPPRYRHAAREPDADTDWALREVLGYDETRIDALREAGAIP